jgi:hypothetical protein
MAASGHGPTIGFGPHLDGSTSDSGQGNRAGLTRPEARVEAAGMVSFWLRPADCGQLSEGAPAVCVQIRGL